jgi:hypothetical protein
MQFPTVCYVPGISQPHLNTLCLHSEEIALEAGWAPSEGCRLLAGHLFTNFVQLRPNHKNRSEPGCYAFKLDILLVARGISR